MRTEINKNRKRPSERWEEARGKGVKQGKNSWGVGDVVYAPLPPQMGPVEIGIFEVYNCQKRNFLAENAGHFRQIDI